jgi:hypothetical protein
VIQVDGTPVRITGPMFRARPVRTEHDTLALWLKCYYRMRNAKEKSFQDAYNYFRYAHGYYPPRDLPLMPRDNYDWQRVIRRVRKDRLVPLPPGARPGTRRRKKATPDLFDNEVPDVRSE